MAKRLSERIVASVQLLLLELSEDELTVLAAALTTLLKEGDDRAVEDQSGASCAVVCEFMVCSSV